MEILERFSIMEELLLGAWRRIMREYSSVGAEIVTRLDMDQVKMDKWENC